jgi:DnaK suppressor protein
MPSQTHGSAPADSAAGRETYSRFERKLRHGWDELRDEVCDALARTRDEGDTDIAGRVGDVEGQSLADLLVDVNLVAVTREVGEIRDIERALLRMALGTYGTCVSCGEPIERGRLEVYPTANRCAGCQRAHEHDHLTTLTPRL